MRRISVALIAFLLVLPGTSVFGQQMPPGASATDDSEARVRFERANQILLRFVVEQKIAGAVAAVVEGDSIVWQAAVGLSDLESGTPMRQNTIFRIYSMTKPVTAVAAMMLQEEGKFNLDDPVSKYLPEFRNMVVATDQGTRRPASEIKVRDLFLHTSGLNHRTSAPYAGAGVRSRSESLETFIGKISRVPLMEDPGTRYRYSEGPTVLGRLIEVWSGQPLDQFLRTRIFEPLKMTDTGFQVMAADRGRFATVYTPSSTGGLQATDTEELPFTERPALLEGAVGLVSTVPDYLRFSRMLLNRGELDGVRILRPETVDLITRNSLSAEVQAQRGGAFGWGLANVNVLLRDDAANYMADAGEYGWNGSAGTAFWVEPTTNQAIVVMTQITPTNPEQFNTQFRAALRFGE
ncbi:MAG: beta-lactamase family protein [Gemmatimonadota bacterium]|jgi:CubicO group peptidase (beta-lactamase class C family)|nr:beta-lactamase family protein [Gemmatimonadota bacterium]